MGAGSPQQAAPVGTPAGLDYAGWLSLGEACARSGLSAATVRRYAATGKIRQATVAGSVVYDPETLPGPAAEQDAVVDVLKVQTAALRESHEQSRVLLDKLIGLTGFVDRIVGSLEREASELRTQRATLEAELRAGRALVEKIQTDEEDRRMARAAFDAAQDRARKLTEKFASLIDPVMSALMFKVAPGSRAVQDSVLAHALEKLDDEDVTLIANHPKFDATERAAILEMRRELVKQRAARDAAAAAATEQSS